MILMADIITPITGTDTIRRCGSSGRQNEERMASCCRVEAARNLTMTLKQPSAAVAASMGKAKLAGLIVDRRTRQTRRLRRLDYRPASRVYPEWVAGLGFSLVDGRAKR